MVDLPRQGPFTAQLRTGEVVENVYRTKDESEYAYTAFADTPTDEDLTYPWRSPKRNGVDEHMAWYANGAYSQNGPYNMDIVGVVTEVPKPTNGNYIIVIDVRDNQPLMFGTNNIAISKQVQPLIDQLKNQYHINASTHHDTAMEDKFLDNVRKLKSADMVLRFDGHWWPVRFVKTVSTLQEALESI